MLQNRLALTALSNNQLNDVVYQTNALHTDKQMFNVKIPFEGAPVTNQRSSGRCWIFAATNVFRVAIMKKHNLSTFELSQAYLFFWDKLEKANWFLEQVIDTADEDLEGRLVQRMFRDPVGDGGQWDMLANLVAKYGLVCQSFSATLDKKTDINLQVPQSLYPDAAAAQKSYNMDGVITAKLREDALILRSMCTTNTNSRRPSLPVIKARMLKDIHRILTIMLGPPPKPDSSFAWEYLDADSKYHTLSKTPLEFAKELSSPSLTRVLHGADVNAFFSLVHDPRNTPFILLTVSRLGNVIGGRPTTYVNVDMQTLKNAAIKMLKAGLPVFFGCDVGKSSNSTAGIMDEKMFNYDLVFDIGLNMDKAQRLKTGASAITHAMVLTGVHIGENGKSLRWRVQNSWGGDAGTEGYWVMSDGWMDEFVYQVVVGPGFVGKEVRDVLDSKPVVLPLWDPMGALA
jgi:bleomycin hydrolase